MGYLSRADADRVRARLGIRPPRSSFMIDPMGEAVSTIDSAAIISPPVHPIYQMPPTPAPPAPAPPTAPSLSLSAPTWLWYAALGGVVYYWWFRKKEP